MGRSMTQEQIFNLLSRGGPAALPWLIKLSHPEAGALYFVNNNVDIEYMGQIFKSSAFKYAKPQTVGGVLQNGQLIISAIDNQVIELIDSSNELFTVDAVGVLEYDGEITPFKMYHHQYGTVTINENLQVTITFTNDDRLEMIFPPYTFDADNNRGNA